MSIPKKGSRSIVVDGIKYRWRVRKEPTNLESEIVWNGGRGTMTVAVENADISGSVLLVHLEQPHPGIANSITSVPVKPSQIVEYIKDALAQGWKATESGNAFQLTPENKNRLKNDRF